MLARKLLLFVAMISATAGMVMAQSYNDDDIYYNPAKDKKTRLDKQQQQYAPASSIASGDDYYDPTLGGVDFAPAGSYAPGVGSSTRAVDEYNRRGQFAMSDSIAAVDSINTDDFKYTRRIEKYHNRDIVSSLNDPDLVEYYYDSDPEINVYNINVVGGYPGYWGYGSPWHWNSSWYYWNSPWYWNSWDYYLWGPSWSWSWGWGPSWSWGYPGYYPGYYPGWGHGHHHWYPDYGGPSIALRPHGASTGRQPIGIRNGYTGVGHSNSSSLRPQGGSSNRGASATSVRGSVGNYRPGAVSTDSRQPSNSGTSIIRRPSTNGSTTVTPQRQSSTERNSWGTSRGNRNNDSYNNNSSNSSRSYSAPTQNSSSSRGGGFSGGSTSSGGSSHRGGRR